MDDNNTNDNQPQAPETTPTPSTPPPAQDSASAPQSAPAPEPEPAMLTTDALDKQAAEAPKQSMIDDQPSPNSEQLSPIDPSRRPSRNPSPSSRSCSGPTCRRPCSDSARRSRSGPQSRAKLCPASQPNYVSPSYKDSCRPHHWYHLRRLRPHHRHHPYPRPNPKTHANYRRI